MNKNSFKTFNSQKGVSLLITFIVMSISLAIVLGVSVILVSEIKLMRGMGYSVMALYATDTGVEKLLYYDRKVLPPGDAPPGSALRGICYICSDINDEVGHPVCPDCDNCTAEGPDCDPLTCTDCTISFSTPMKGGQNYTVEGTVALLGDSFKITGAYKNLVKRAIEITTGGINIGPGTAPVIWSDTDVIPSSQQPGYSVTISAHITDKENDLNPDSIKAHIRHYDPVLGGFVEDAIVSLTSPGGDVYSGTWTGPVGAYYVDINACDDNGHCTQATDI